MLIVEKARVIALKLNNPNRVLDSIPTAKTYEVHGIPLVITPHKLDEVKVLRNLGIKAPSPMLHYYNWPGQYIPYDHQKETAAFLTLQQRGLVLTRSVRARRRVPCGQRTTSSRLGTSRRC